MYYDNFEHLCKINNVKPSQVSKATGISTATLSSWKKGKYTPKQDKLQLIANYFKVSIDYIISIDNNNISIEQHPFHQSLTPEEQIIIMQYRSCSDESRASIRNVINSFYQSSPKPSHPESSASKIG